MAVNLQEKGPEASKTVFRWFRRFHGPYWPYIVVIVIFLLLVVSAVLLYAHTKEDKAFGYANLLLQGAGLVVAGLILTPLIRYINKLRNQRMSFMHRIREAHVQVANAQRLIYADRSCTTYSEQMRVLMLVTPKLEDIERDIAATTGLFKHGDKARIREGITEIVTYLDKGYDQYVEWCNGEDYETLRQKKPGWLAELVRCRRSMPEAYGHGLDKSKGTIRCYVYGGGTDKAKLEQNKDRVRRFVNEILNAGNLASADELLADDFALRLPRLAIECREDFMENLRHWQTDFPDWRTSIERLTADDDKVVGCCTCEARHSARLMGIVATGKWLSWTANVILRIENGRITEVTAEGEMLDLMRQLESAPESTSAE
jgi:predicted ester cyclase